MDIILLIFLCYKIAAIAEQKNASKVRWILTTVFYWITGEMLGMLLLVTVLVSIGRLDPEKLEQLQEMPKEMLFVICAGYLCGYLGYLFTRKRIEALPDSARKIE